MTAPSDGAVDWQEHIVCDPGILCGKPTLKGTRLSVELVLDLLASGFTRKDIDENYPNLSEDRVRAALAFAADAVRQTGTRVFFASPQDAETSQVELRLPKGTQLTGIPNLRYMLQLMACLEAINAAVRWGVYVERDPVGGIVRDLDRIMVLFVGVGWCHEAFRLLRHRQAKTALDRSMLAGRDDLLALWDKIISDPPDPLVTKVEDIRNKFFGHFDATVMGKFVDWQVKHGASTPFFVGDETGHSSRCRFLWPLDACLAYLAGDPSEGDFVLRVEKMFASLEDVLKGTLDLLHTLIDAWMDRRGLKANSAWDITQVKQD